MADTKDNNELSRFEEWLAASDRLVARILANRDGKLLDVDTIFDENYLKQRAKRGDRAKYEAVLAKAPDVEPEEYDRLD